MASASSNDPTSSTSNSILIDHSTDFAAAAAASSIHFNDFDTLNDVPMNLLPAGNCVLSCLSSSSFDNQN